MAENFVNILREIRGKTLAPATDRDCIYGDIKWMYGVIESYQHQQINPEVRLKLESIEEGATKNSTDAFLLSRANHTGVQSADTIVGNLDASRITESSAKQFVTSTQKGRIFGSEQRVNRGVPNGYVPLDGNGKMNPSYLQSLDLVNVYTPVDFDAMLLLSSAEPGDVSYVQDIEEAYMLVGLPSDDRLNWKELNSDVGVISINGLTGAVSISSDDLPEGSVNKYFTEVRETEIKESIEEAESRLDIIETTISNSILTRADKYLASQNVVKMIYNLEGKLSKVRYNNDTDVDYEVLTRNLDGKLSNVAHYVEGLLRGNTTLSYENGKLVAAPYTAV